MLNKTFKNHDSFRKNKKKKDFKTLNGQKAYLNKMLVNLKKISKKAIEV